MRHYYFAYGSNMSRPRLEARVGVVDVVGCASLEGYRHAFSKRGADGSGKGNIERDPGAIVHGVVYQLDDRQFAALHPYENGYRMLEVDVVVRATVTALRATTYEALEPLPGLVPTLEYVAHYRNGIAEHRLPDDYAAIVLAQAAEGRRR